MRHTKRKIFLLAMIICCVAIAAVGTLAYFTDLATAHNVITSGNVDIELHEWADRENSIPFTDRTGIMPGTSVTKWVEVENVGSASAWVRAKVNITVTPAASTTIGGIVTDTPINETTTSATYKTSNLGIDDPVDEPADAPVDEPAETLPNGCISLDIGADWTYNESDGYYYYNAPLAAGGTTSPLFTTVTFDAVMGNAYQNANVSVDVLVYAVQTANNGESALTAAGWPAEITK